MILIGKEESKLVSIGKTKGLTNLDGVGSSGSTTNTNLEDRQASYESEIIEE
jgi:trimethylamine:corrinoid methyltransferase-like protein